MQSIKTKALRRANGGGDDNDDRREYRPLCYACRRPRPSCYCPLIEPFESAPRFVILTQPREARHRLGTGRMARLCLSNSILLEGVDFSRDPRVNGEIEHPGVLPFVLYPGPDALNLSSQTAPERAAWIAVGHRLLIFVLDGTWTSASKMLRASANLGKLPRLCFEPEAPSNYRIRRQPQSHCYATIEAIHFVLDWFAPTTNDDAKAPAHTNLLSVFNAVVDRQLTYSRRA